MALFHNKYRIESTRLKNWDYARQGAYFITICTKDRIHYFGEIENGKMNYSPIGAIADVLWYEIKNRTNNVELGEFVVVPNHIHGILFLIDNPIVETLHATSLQQLPKPQLQIPTNEKMGIISPKKGSVSTIIRSYKSAAAKHANRLGLDFLWQSRFHDHIIRDDKSFNNITEYILYNPLTWAGDKFNNSLKNTKPCQSYD